MPEAPSILYDAVLKKSKDYHWLRKEAIALAQQMSSQVWTDYNEHDPGITILEQFCYALTDIAYRTNIDIEQLLFSDGDYTKVSEANALFHPRDIIRCGPTTLLDYRILIINRIKEVSNAWVMAVKPEDTKQNVHGLYDIVLKVSDDFANKPAIEIQNKVKEQFVRHFRNVGEDINSIKVLKPVPIKVCFNMEIAQDVIGEELLAEVYYQINNYLNPPVRFHTYEELKEQGIDVFDIYETPSFCHGFIRKDELDERMEDILISQIDEIMTRIKGVRNINGFHLKKDNLKIYGDTLNVGQDHYPELENLSTDLPSEVVLLKGGVPYDYDHELILHLYSVKIAQQKREYKVKTQRKTDTSYKKINLSELAKFSSIQNTLPGVYGVGRYELPGDVGMKRLAQAKQLKGYLYFFDQIMANHLAQLERIRVLFSLEDSGEVSYYSKLPVEFSGKDDLLDDASEEMLNEITRDFDNAANRKNKILDHLLSRFAERFKDNLQGNFKTLFGDLSTDQITAAIVKLKIKFLKNYKHLSRERSKGFDYMKPLEGKENKKELCAEDELNESTLNDNLPTFQKRVYLLLNIDCEEPRKEKKAEEEQSKEPDEKIAPLFRSLVEHYTNKPPKVYKTNKVETNHLELSGGKKVTYKSHNQNEHRFTFLIKDKNVVNSFLTFGQKISSYNLLPLKSDRFAILFRSLDKDTPVRICEVDSLKEGTETIEKLTRYIKGINQKSEGFHVVEHLLLRSQAVTEYNFHVLGAKDERLFDSIEGNGLDIQKQVVQEALISACQLNGYVRIENNEGKHFLYIVDRKGRRLMRYKKYLTSETAAVKRTHQLMSYFKELDEMGDAIDKRVIFSLVATKADLVGNDFFKSKMSIVLPDWVPRFKTPEFEPLLKNAVDQSIPAHLYVNYVWLSIEKMKAFEKAYSSWLKERSVKDANSKKLDEASGKLITILSQEKNG